MLVCLFWLHVQCSVKVCRQPWAGVKWSCLRDLEVQLVKWLRHFIRSHCWGYHLTYIYTTHANALHCFFYDFKRM